MLFLEPTPSNNQVIPFFEVREFFPRHLGLACAIRDLFGAPPSFDPLPTVLSLNKVTITTPTR